MAKRQYWEARLLVAVVLGLGCGYAIGTSLAKDAERGRALTMKDYVNDFERHKAELESAAMPMTAAVIGGALLVVGALGVYELLALGLARALGVFRRSDEEQRPWNTVPPIDRGG